MVFECIEPGEFFNEPVFDAMVQGRYDCGYRDEDDDFNDWRMIGFLRYEGVEQKGDVFKQEENGDDA